MGDEVRADPQALVRLAKTTLGGADGMTAAWSAAQGGVTPAGSAFGNSLEGGRGAAAATEAAAAMDDTWRQVTAVYESDVDKLYRVAFAYQQADREAAERQRRTGGGPRAI
ncbi:hypothetical protein Aab01nite_31460 [Paractinoplanes abujensis]|uniref:Excreted virulence factor EspC (Type VII ESX diderm) n=1 Tax=Paractinoplanes abujensis TaxID=882441 RepID=A0A7W7G8I1_9ACTN|nr:hypothetical protein [Actinoplanes abujensis]MBB4697961.1 hypothetical protein [Actinoplanes abujensis]GID19556.1 hypothetical protein Aab01nite_31460 [Actinoplanes abujensis]